MVNVPDPLESKMWLSKGLVRKIISAHLGDNLFLIPCHSQLSHMLRLISCGNCMGRSHEISCSNQWVSSNILKLGFSLHHYLFHAAVLCNLHLLITSLCRFTHFIISSASSAVTTATRRKNLSYCCSGYLQFDHILPEEIFFNVILWETHLSSAASDNCV